MPVSELTLLLEQRVCGVEILDLPCLASGYNSNLTSEDMADIRRQVIAVDNNNDPDPSNIISPENIPLPQPEEENSWISEGIICPRRSNNLHNTYSYFNNYSHEEVMNMTKLDMFLNWRSTAEPTMSGVAPLRINKYM